MRTLEITMATALLLVGIGLFSMDVFAELRRFPPSAAMLARPFAPRGYLGGLDRSGRHHAHAGLPHRAGTDQCRR